MIPSLLARDLETGLTQFLKTSYGPSDATFGGLINRFVESRSADWLKGPYVQLGLPFRGGTGGESFFESFKLEHPGYVHQEAAWQRLASDRLARNTLVATGTGSGKTECFLYPVLDHCARMRAEGLEGIKALVIYPMNALATDQAARFARAVARSPAFAGLRVGLFVGGLAPGLGNAHMTTEQVITERDALRQDPPDVLLTNYKMLDYLLIRPRDRQLWARNEPDTLRYIVVDELHTFDGAQGTDLAMLLRRMRHRLKLDPERLICVGTSATLGGGGDTAPLREYARQVFGAAFEPESVITENRLSESEFIGNVPVEFLLQAVDEPERTFDPERLVALQQGVAAAFELLFPDQPVPAGVDDPAWRAGLGGLLKKHLLFQNLIKHLAGGAVLSMDELCDRMQPTIPARLRPWSRQVIEWLLVLVAWARSGGHSQFLSLRVQLWGRELKRMVASVAAEPENIALASSADLPAARERFYLPVVQCIHCHTTGWLGLKDPVSSRINDSLENIYQAWFGSSTDLIRLYGRVGIHSQYAKLQARHLCATCGSLQGEAGHCDACGHHELAVVWAAEEVYTRTTASGAAAARHDKTCPACGHRDRMLILGAASATLASVSIEHSWASPFNDDKKLIAFSDAVQDAAHRAGFFGARTFTHNVRTAIAKVVDSLPAGPTPLLVFLDAIPAYWRQANAITGFDPDRLDAEFVAEFIAPNMLWQRDWADSLMRQNVLPAGSRLPGRVSKRLQWEAFAEFTYRSHRGRTLDRIGTATLSFDVATIDAVAEALLQPLAEELGLRDLDQRDVFQWLWGTLTRLRQLGAVAHPEMSGYLTGGSLWALIQPRREWLPAMGLNALRPSFVAFDRVGDHVPLVGSDKTWFQQWFKAALVKDRLVATNIERVAYGFAFDRLIEVGVLQKEEFRGQGVYGLDPRQVFVVRELERVAAPAGERKLTVASDVAERLLGMPCLDAMDQTYTEREGAASWLADRFRKGDLRRVIAGEHTGMLKRDEREALETRFKAESPLRFRWYENLLSSTPTLEMGVDIGSLSSVLLCSVPPNQASFLQRIGRAGRRDGNAMVMTLADGNRPHDLYFFQNTCEMLAGKVEPPGIFLEASEVLRRQLCAFCLDSWVASGIPENALPRELGPALNEVEKPTELRFPYDFIRFTIDQRDELLEQFIGMLDKPSTQLQARLTAFFDGGEDIDSMAVALVKMLQDLVAERQSYRDSAKALKTLADNLAAQPQDEATTKRLEEAKRQRGGYLELIKEITGRDLLNALTDAGLIPNYAFPEIGVELKSVLWRKKGEDDPEGSAYVSLPVERYERSASSALGEFAPGSVFYANRRRLLIDQINLDLVQAGTQGDKTAEEWQLCPSCHHWQNLAKNPVVADTCPSCGAAGWSDTSQRVQLLRFRQAIANTRDDEARIDDSSDEREQAHHVRQMLVDFESSAISNAYRIRDDEVPFGFEFIAKASFADINFGNAGGRAEPIRVADRPAPRPGFSLCRHCGSVQGLKPPRRGQPPSQTHSLGCKAKDPEAADNIIQRLYLYREFHSEALRILVPYTRHGTDDESVQSFIAALQYGLKSVFGGKVDHIRVVTQDMPGPGGGPTHRYVLLYDTVPGGTGYLDQLLANGAQTLANALRYAYQGIKGCACQHDDTKDGCYSCVYQYKLHNNMRLVSRRRGLAILEDLLGALDKLEPVETISVIGINSQLGSELERRFIESLRKLSGKFDLPVINLVQSLLNGKVGWQMRVGKQRYRIEPQVDVGPEYGVTVQSRPDFVIWPIEGRGVRRPIAVFCDGWEFHKDISTEDARKRSALLASGKFWVWSVSWQDVMAAMDARQKFSDLEPQLRALFGFDGSPLPWAQFPHIQPYGDSPESLFHGPMLALLSWLATPIHEGVDTRSERLRLSATALMVRVATRCRDPQVKAAADAFWAGVTDPPADRPEGSSAVGIAADHGAAVYFALPAAAIKAADPAPSIGFSVYAPNAGASEAECIAGWRLWLHLSNLLQFLPHVALATPEALRAGTLPNFRPADHPAEPDGVMQADAAWTAILNDVLDSLRNPLATLAREGLPPPSAEPGYELLDGGQVVAEAELVWEAQKVCLLPEHQFEYEDAWTSRGWRVIRCEGEWATSLRDALSEEMV